MTDEEIMRYANIIVTNHSPQGAVEYAAHLLRQAQPDWHNDPESSLLAEIVLARVLGILAKQRGGDPVPIP